MVKGVLEVVLKLMVSKMSFKPGLNLVSNCVHFELLQRMILFLEGHIRPCLQYIIAFHALS